MRRALPWLLAGLVVSPLPFLPDRASTSPGPAGLVGAHLHSRWLDPASPLGQDALLRLARDTGLQMVAFGAPLATAEGRAAAPSILDRWLGGLGATRAVPEFNTLALPAADQQRAGLQRLFAGVAPVLGRHDNVLLAAGANEPLTKGRAWSASEAEQRVRAEHDAWHAASDVPFCHKFTNPRINAPGLDWGALERLWAEAQDAICYDWYASNGDTIGTLDQLRALGQRLHKPLYVLETAVPGDDPRTLADMARRADGVCVYQLLASPGGEDERLAAWVARPGGMQARPPAAMLRAALGVEAPAGR
jgi:hypothetical protein